MMLLLRSVRAVLKIPGADLLSAFYFAFYGSFISAKVLARVIMYVTESLVGTCSTAEEDRPTQECCNGRHFLERQNATPKCFHLQLAAFILLNE